MQNPGKDVVELARVLLRGTVAERQRAVDTCFTHDAQLSHNLVWLIGRTEIMAVYQYWSDINLNITFDIPKVIASENKEYIVLDFDEYITPFWLPFANVLLRLIVILKLRHTSSGYKISLQEDHILWEESFRKNIPPLNFVYEQYIRRATGLTIVKTMEAGALAARFLCKTVLPHIPGVQDNPKVKAKLQQLQEGFDPHKLEEWRSSEKQVKGTKVQMLV
jgi:hypothetical protein